MTSTPPATTPTSTAPPPPPPVRIPPHGEGVSYTISPPDPLLPAGLDAIDPEKLATVPEHLREHYVSAIVPEDVLRRAVSGKIASYPVIDGIQDIRDRGSDSEYRHVRATHTGYAPGAAETIHEHRLQAAQRAYDQAQRQATPHPRCPVCAAPFPKFNGLCQPCAVLVQQVRQERAPLPDGRTRRQAVEEWLDRQSERTTK